MCERRGLRYSLVQSQARFKFLADRISKLIRKQAICEFPLTGYYCAMPDPQSHSPAGLPWRAAAAALAAWCALGVVGAHALVGSPSRIMADTGTHPHTHTLRVTHCSWTPSTRSAAA